MKAMLRRLVVTTVMLATALGCGSAPDPFAPPPDVAAPPADALKTPSGIASRMHMSLSATCAPGGTGLHGIRYE